MAKKWLDAQQTTMTSNRRQAPNIYEEDAELVTCQSDAAWRAETNVVGLGWIIRAQGNRDMPPPM